MRLLRVRRFDPLMLFLAVRKELELRVSAAWGPRSGAGRGGIKGHVRGTILRKTRF